MKKSKKIDKRKKTHPVRLSALLDRAAYLAEQHYWMTCCPNVPYAYFKKEWWEANNNGLVVEALAQLIANQMRRAIRDYADFIEKEYQIPIVHTIEKFESAT